MRIQEVQRSKTERYIPVQGWVSVIKALSAYSNGTPGSQATSERMWSDSSQSSTITPGMAIFALAHMTVNPNQFVSEMLNEAHNALHPKGLDLLRRRRDEWEKHFDYDGAGTVFFKTSVQLYVLDRETEMYAVGLWAAYVGDQPEQKLAEYLGIPRTVLSEVIDLKVEPLDDERFEFDFETLLRSLDRVMPTHDITGDQLVEHFMSGTIYSDPDEYLLHRENGCVVTLDLGRVERRFMRPDKDLVDTWEAEDSVLRGLRDESYGAVKVKEIPTLQIVIQREKKERYDTVPIYLPEMKQYVNDLAEKIAAVVTEDHSL